MNPLIIPSIFTGVDRLSPTMLAMQRNATTFGGRMEASLNRAERAFRRIVPGLGEMQKQLLSLASTGAVIGAGMFATKSIMDYETELANLKSLTGATDKEFGGFKSQIEQVATETRKSTVQIAQAFTAIANNQPELLKNPEDLAKVTRATVNLAKAARMDMQPAGEALTQILNQYGKGAADRAKTVDILAAGSVAGSSEIRDTADAIQKFGTVANNMGVSIKESVALVELGSKFEKGADAGVKFRNILLEIEKGSNQDKKALMDMYRAGINMKVLTNTALPLNTRLKEMSKILKTQNGIMNVFGKENAAMATGILSNIDLLPEMLKQVSTVGVAENMAATNSNTLANRFDELKNVFVNVITTGKSTGGVLNFVKNAVVFLTDHMEGIIDTIITAVKWIAIAKVGLLAWRGAMIAYNVVIGISNILTGAFGAAVAESTIATQVANGAVRALTAVQWLWNAALSANPIGLVIIALAGLVTAAIAFKDQFEGWDELWSNTWTGMGYMLDSFAYGFKYSWGVITNVFISEVDRMKQSWYGFQVSLGKMSQEQYNRRVSFMNKERGIREVENAQNKQLMNLSSANASLYTNNPLKWKSNTSTSDDPALAALQRRQEIRNLQKEFVDRFVEVRKQKAFEMVDKTYDKLAAYQQEKEYQQNVNFYSTKTAEVKNNNPNNLPTWGQNAKVEIEVKAPAGSTQTKTNSDMVHIKTTSTQNGY